MKKLTLFLTTLLTTLLSQAPLWACEGCKMSASGGVGMLEPQTVRAGIALSWSVLFMLFTVLVILAGFSWMLYRTCLQADQAHALCSKNPSH